MRGGIGLSTYSGLSGFTKNSVGFDEFSLWFRRSATWPIETSFSIALPDEILPIRGALNYSDVFYSLHAENRSLLA
jgi:hypothetical protein